MISPAPDPEAMELRLLAVLQKRERKERLDERERRILAYYDGGQCASCAAPNVYLRR